MPLQSRIMHGRQIPDIFHQFQSWMEVRDEVVEDICMGLYKIDFSYTSSNENNEETASDKMQISSVPPTQEKFPESEVPEKRISDILRLSHVSVTSSGEITEATGSEAKSSDPSTSSSGINEASMSAATPESSMAKRKLDEEFEASKKSKTHTAPEGETQAEVSDPYLQFEKLAKLLTLEEDPDEEYLAHEKKKAKFEIFEKFFKKWEASQKPYLSFINRLEEEGEGVETDRLEVILRVLAKTQTPALDEWINACIENGVGPIEGIQRDPIDTDHSFDVPSTSYSSQEEYDFQLLPYSGQTPIDDRMISNNEVSSDSIKAPIIETISDDDMTSGDSTNVDSGVISDSAGIFNEKRIPRSRTYNLSDKPDISDNFVRNSGLLPDSGIVVDFQKPDEQGMNLEFSIDDCKKFEEFGLKLKESFVKYLVQRGPINADQNLCESSYSYSNEKETPSERIQKKDVEKTDDLYSCLELAFTEAQIDKQQTVSSTQDSEIPSKENVNKETSKQVFSKKVTPLSFIITNPETREQFSYPGNINVSVRKAEEAPVREADEASVGEADEPPIVAISPASEARDDWDFKLT